MTLGILFGGNSKEHEISIVSAFQLKKKLEDSYDIVMLYLDFDNNLSYSRKCSIRDFKNKKLRNYKKTSFIQQGFKKLKIDLVILAGHGENTEDGTLASVCNFYNIKYVGCDNLSSSVLLNKYFSYLVLKQLDFKVVDSYYYSYYDYVNGKNISEYPVILKPITGGSSLGIIVLKNKEDFDLNISKLFVDSKEYIVQKYYDDIEEYNLAVSSKYTSNLEVITKKDEIFSFENKYNESFKQMHQKIINNRIKEFKDIGRRLYDSMGLKGIIRIDFFIIDNEIYINEVNTIPGALAMYLFDDFVEVINYEINTALTEKKPKYSIGDYLSKNEINK